ncbi:spore protease YyaC [Alicyclobacillus tolerans]|uniref:spore protease YyaC n=1 Tax=Alicyclobacillus tolerans TaxID=90970 RepID=UPI001F1BD5B6|nr:spore protease YyaC [Alicyclobacillus tolerans]MCF8565698.1 spore protease YyaC [Alicyclobacillus tolerans]
MREDDQKQDLTQPTQSLSLRVSFDEENSVRELAEAFDLIFDEAGNKPIAIVCVGTDRSTGDAFGPIIGTKLKAAVNFRGVNVYGTLDEPVHAVNLAQTLEQLHQSHREPPFIFAIDACLGKFEHVGHIIVERGPLHPGAGVKKSLPEFGEFTVTGVVNVSGFMEYFVLQNTRLGIVMRMTDVVVEALKNSLTRWKLRSEMAGLANRA